MIRRYEIEPTEIPKGSQVVSICASNNCVLYQANSGELTATEFNMLKKLIHSIYGIGYKFKP